VHAVSVQQALALASASSATVPLPAAGATAQRWQYLAGLAAQDLTTARVVEAHLDAVAVLAEAGAWAAPAGTWGVFAAEASGVRLDAHETPGGWRLAGTKPWCSLASDLSHALVTAHTSAGRRLFAVDLATGRDDGSVVVEPGAWHSRGLVDVPSGPVHLHDAVAEPVGEAGWYLHRAGFAHGGIGVAACWYGGAVGVARALRRTGKARDQLAHHHRGLVDLRLRTARLALEAAASAVDSGRATGRAGQLLAAQTRSLVAESAEDVLRIVGHALGPAPLTFDATHAARVADLTLYLRQDHAERDVAALGEMLAGQGPEEGSGWPS
jgi:alkylation response protein AidB-like acyl-CoA dehydrogenase